MADHPRCTKDRYLYSTSEDEDSSSDTELRAGGGTELRDEDIGCTNAGFSAIICLSLSPAAWPLMSDRIRLCFR